MAIADLKSRIDRLPEQPGVYIFSSPSGETLYVGKARVLRDRVRSYLAAEGASPRHDALLRQVAALETIVTDSVVEALALENELIKQRNPRFNILLRDDKTYPYLKLTTNEPAPRVLVARRVERDGAVYAGPYMPATLARRTMALTHKLFGIRSCNEVIDGRRDRPCLEYDIKRCVAPCVASICTLEQYQQSVAQARLLLEGRQAELVAQLQTEMIDAATDERYERAAFLRDAIRTLETLETRQQKLATPSLGDRDAVAVKVGPAGAIVQIFQMRRGRVVDRVEMTSGVFFDDDEDEKDTRRLVLEAALQQFYADQPPPPEVLLADALPDETTEALEAWLGGRAGRKVRLLVPQRGDKRGLLDLALRNAALAYDTQFGEGHQGAFEALDTLRVVLGLPTLPHRIECFDISTLQGTNTVASMVVCVDGRMRRSDYRKFTVRGPATDDFASMEEVVLRRYRGLLERGGPFPDLILIDGGKGQLTAAYAALRQVGLESLVAVGLAKQEELLFRRDRVEGIALPHDTPALRLVQRIRDEAHRFAVTFHRTRRAKSSLRSALDDIAGIGPRRRRQLLTAFGSVAGVRRASREDLTRVAGAKVADAVLKHFQS